MNRKQRGVLDAVFSDPVSRTIAWSDLESLLKAAGAEVVEGNGSRVRFVCKGVVATFRRPHPEKEARRYQIRDARDFLTKIGVEP
jgi:hypothetical protein